MPEKRTTRVEQREQTRQRIVAAATDAFAEGGFEGTSTRDIADRAGVTQGLVTYHFASKRELWGAAVDAIFAELGHALPTPDDEAGGPAPDQRAARLAIRAYVSFSARHPELFQLMVDAGRHDDERMRWIVDRHLRPHFGRVARFAGQTARDADAAHVYYALVGAASLISAVSPECRALTGVDPRTEAAIGRHADVVAALFAP